AVGEITELRLPADERLGIIPAEAVLEPECRRFGERRVVEIEEALPGAEAPERHVSLARLRVEEDRVPLVESAAAAVLAGETHRCSLLQERAEGERFGHPPVDRPRAAPHLEPLLEPPFHLGMNVETVRDRGDPAGDPEQPLLADRRVDLE